MTSMMTNESSGQILLLLTCLLSVSTKLICPDTGFIDSPAQLYCSGGTISHEYINPNGRTVAQRLLTGEGCDADPSMCISVLNATHTTLIIGRVQLSDAGTWKCVTGSGEATCHLSVANDSCRCDESGSTVAMGMGIVIIVMIVIIVLLLVKNLSTKNAGWKMCSIIRSLPWFKRNHSNQVQKHMEADGLQIQVPPKPMPAEDQIPEVPTKPMSAEDQIPAPFEIHRKTSSSRESTV